MSNRTIRRAAERQSLKAAAKLQKLQTPPAVAAEPQSQPHAMSAAAGAAAPASIPTPGFNEETVPYPAHQSTIRVPTEAQLAANRANSQRSTGPVTAEGKAKSSLNAIKTGLTGATVLLPTDDAIAYQAHLDRHFKQESPATDQEHTLVQMVADAEWRILRIPGLEASIHALGRLKLADLHPEESDPAARQSLINGEVFLAYRRDLSNLALQERRLRNQMKSDQEKLHALKTERLEQKEEKAKVQARMDEAIRAMLSARKNLGSFNPAQFGFEFSVAEIEHCHTVLYSMPRTCTAAVLAHFRNSENKEQKAA